MKAKENNRIKKARTKYVVVPSNLCGLGSIIDLRVMCDLRVFNFPEISKNVFSLIVYFIASDFNLA